MDELLRVESLCAGYGQRRVLRDVSFSVRRGELCALLGANGSGKSTLLRALCGLTDAPEGCMLLEAESLRDMSCRRRAQRIGYLAQRSTCELALSVMDVVLMQVALAEILTFPSIPLNVTFNEYLDLAKVYSTPRSAAYINGMLDHIVKQLREEKKLLK